MADDQLFVRIGQIIEGGATGPTAIIALAVIVVATLLIVRFSRS